MIESEGVWTRKRLSSCLYDTMSVVKKLEYGRVECSNEHNGQAKTKCMLDSLFGLGLVDENAAVELMKEESFRIHLKCSGVREILTDILTSILEEKREVISKLFRLLRGLNMNGSESGQSWEMMSGLRKAVMGDGRWEELILLGEVVGVVKAKETVGGYADLLSQQFSSSVSRGDDRLELFSQSVDLSLLLIVCHEIPRWHDKRTKLGRILKKLTEKLEEIDCALELGPRPARNTRGFTIALP